MEALRLYLERTRLACKQTFENPTLFPFWHPKTRNPTT